MWSGCESRNRTSHTVLFFLLYLCDPYFITVGSVSGYFAFLFVLNYFGHKIC